MNTQDPSLAELPEARPVSTQGDHAAYVVHVVSNLSGTPYRLLCPELSPELADRILEPALLGQDVKPRLKRLWGFVERRELPGLAVFNISLTSEPLIPCRPIRVQFEPVPLDETHPTLANLAELSAGSNAVAPLGRKTWALGRRFGVRAGIVIAWVGFCFMGVVRDLLTSGFRALDLFAWVILAIVPVAFGQFLLWWITDNWVLIPGGVVVRNLLGGRGNKALRRYTPSTAMLFLSERGPGWLAKICNQEKTLHQCRLTRVEAIALLAAWQSPLRPPDEAKLVDLE